MIADGIIFKGIGGFYYVKTANETVTCKARGIFRKERLTPYIGDKVKISFENLEEGLIEEILPRRNFLVRPPIANIDKLFIVISTTQPSPNTFIIDKTLAVAEIKEIEPILIITKIDLDNYDNIKEIYSSVGIKIICVSSLEGDGADAVFNELENCTSAFTGNSGVGKSTLINAILPKLNLQIGEISKSLKRGKHTTRHVELFPVGKAGFVADTPGFSSLDVDRFEKISRGDLSYGFREFEPYMFQCKFGSCTHTCEQGCAVIKAVEDNKIHKSRFDSYISMYNEIKDVKEWQTQKNV